LFPFIFSFMTPALLAAWRKGMPWPPYSEWRAQARKETQMPKMKTKSGAKKRFRFTATGKIKTGQTGKRHGMIKRSNEQIRNLRGTQVLSASETRRIRRWMPYAG
jgi:large subunit ribosomal protein L35